MVTATYKVILLISLLFSADCEMQMHYDYQSFLDREKGIAFADLESEDGAMVPQHMWCFSDNVVKQTPFMLYHGAHVVHILL